METAQEILARLVHERLEELGTNPFALEKSAGLPEDAIRGVLRGSLKSGTTLNRAQQICEALGLELTIGPPRAEAPAAEIRKGGQGFALVPRVEAELAAGAGAENGSEEAVEALAFRTDWLRRMGVNPANARLVKVRGDSMEPLIHDQDIVLIDRGRRSVQSGRVYALLEGSEARVKRLDRPDRKTLVIRSDNPAYPSELRRGPEIDAITVIGQVVWCGHQV
ncbi:MAG: S24 family peptidase [Pseudomonadota bacterium]